ncbi:hypothetical protein SAICODRAFT_32169 [Saitoella complicata NRRL Y-17804]|uniref:HIT-type domain-containing protein n=1 Tax=Saitoella complicata (strain BCRC 22490 / CBS 7301 / JCM 7358 / NBRC 10748 / NRRL Y-17804) TaxID=698492 RepID=A0A0E9NIM5_SAICN|nr:uncharacterized protein SAICODRAFT_32169 [Saitoella complicata NRRL Y-17804]ODQ50032.1 hypothetical protein SAICODRAFT_32169 [Saitoella complicata NRRL Y-17804]GAO49722.1 hypothetical protein G7K_3865-t1 [Saitoella complicata NRRL Y-17804]
MSGQLKKNADRRKTINVPQPIDAGTKATRAVIKHLAELERDNYHDVKIDVPKTESFRKGKKLTSAVRKHLLSRKTFAQLLDEADSPSYQAASSAPSRYPRREFCSVCGYFGTYKCMRCGARYCDSGCKATHLETRCVGFYG